MRVRLPLGRSLLAASVALVHLWSGVTEAHFVFFVVVGVVSLYQHWVPFGIALVVVTAHHGIVGTLYPHEVFGHTDLHAWGSVLDLSVTSSARPEPEPEEES